MSFPSPSEGLFFSSSPAHAEPGPAEEVEYILKQVQQIDQLDLIFDAIVNSNPDAFFDGFSRKVELVKSRSQAFEVCHVTVFDKVLLALTKNGNDLNTTAAIAYYCEEFLGIPSGISPSRKDEVISHILQIPGVIAQALTPPLTQRDSISTVRNESFSPGKEAMDGARSVDLATIVAQTRNEITIRIWKVYKTAKEEFYAITDATSVEKQQAAKFLRDTAENALEHLAKEGDVDPQLNAELERALAVAKHTAEILSGGRKRKFDQPIMRSRRTVDRPEDLHSRAQVQRVRNDHRHKGRNVLGVRQENDRSGDHFRAPSYSSRYDKADSQSRHQLMSPETSPRRGGRDSRNDRDRKRSKKQSGRGHSGIPFGYTRDVDSYQPPS